MVSAVVASMAAFYHDTMDIHNPRHREIFAHRIIAKIPTIAAAAHKHSLGPALHLSAQRPGLRRQPAQHVLRRALRALPASTRSPPRRSTCCSCCTPTTSRTPAPRPCAWRAAPAPIPTRRSRRASRRCGARRTAAPTRRCSRCSSRSAPSTTSRSTWRWPRTRAATSASWASGTASTRTSTRAPRSSARCATRCSPQLGRSDNPLLELALRLEEIALKDEYFIARKLYPNVDFYSGRHLQRDRHPALDVHGDVRDRAHRGLGGALAGDDLRSGHAHRPAAAAVHRARRGATTSRSASAARRVVSAPRAAGR